MNVPICITILGVALGVARVCVFWWFASRGSRGKRR